MKPADLHVGDLCITLNAEVANNNGVLVIIVAIYTDRTTHRGQPAPYRIRRIDGIPHACSLDAKTGEYHWYSLVEVNCVRSKLLKVDAGSSDPRDTVVQVVAALPGRTE